MLVLNDCHIAATRVAGTTPASQIALRDSLRASLKTCLNMVDESEVVLNGDLFHGFTVETGEIIATYEIFSEWLCASHGRRLHLARGNHDWSARPIVSSFQLLSHFLTAHFPSQVRIYEQGFERVTGDIYVIPHVANQDLFNIEIDKAIESGCKGWLLLHCNYKNRFAEAADHSLNLSDDQIARIMIAGFNLVLGHEHIGYTLRGGRVIVVGAQTPSSVSDCIGDDTKHALVINDDGTHELIETWRAEGDYVEVDWKELDTVSDQRFVRVTGDATASQAADVINTIAKVRAASDALIIANAVKVEGVELVADMTIESVDQIKRFDVLSAILEKLEPREAEVVRGLLS